ncbi:MAG: type IV pilus modification protein PilV [Halieaceae bacterium]|jgi:type IV pilus assembly protein PilV|nr:type IV pilus modification protein PilV [Halieaceae bacterium]
MRARQGGAGLVEVAVALLVLSIGTLGLGQLQISAKRLGHEAVQRTEAVALAMDLLERLRANRTALAAYAASGIGGNGSPALAEPAVDCGAGGCSPTQRKDWDLWQWEQALLGRGTGGAAGGLVKPLACLDVSGRRVMVQIAWQGFRGLSAPPRQGICGGDSSAPDVASRQWLQMTTWIGRDQL